MQTFLPHADFDKCAEVLDDKRLYKQIIECKQILDTLRKKEKRDKTIATGIWYGNERPEWLDKKIPWENHPAVKMWKGYEDALRYYQMRMLNEWLDRRWGALLSRDCFNYEYERPFWLRDEKLHDSHKAALYRKGLEDTKKKYGQSTNYEEKNHYRQFQKYNKITEYYWPEEKR